jgi:hypothetical protein
MHPYNYFLASLNTASIYENSVGLRGFIGEVTHSILIFDETMFETDPRILDLNIIAAQSPDC